MVCRVDAFVKLIEKTSPAESRPTQVQVRVGQPAPDFTVEGTQGPITLSQWSGQWVVLYFYPENDTPGCTLEARRFRSYFEAISRQRAAILGVSRDTHANHCSFRDKHALPFELAADPVGEVHDLFGAWKQPLFRRDVVKARRCTFIIDPHGIVRKVYEKVNPATHAAEVVRDLERLAGVN